jgi:hypothetical protein
VDRRPEGDRRPRYDRRSSISTVTHPQRPCNTCFASVPAQEAYLGNGGPRSGNCDGPSWTAPESTAPSTCSPRAPGTNGGYRPVPDIRIIVASSHPSNGSQKHADQL